MPEFSVEVSSQVEKDLRGVPRNLRNRIIRGIEFLAENPFPRQSLKLSGGDRAYRLRVGDYRVIYEVNLGERVVAVFAVRHRRDAYRRR